jgi:predicted acetyltransferase
MWNWILDPPKTTMHIYTVSDASGPQGYVTFTQPSAEGWSYDLSLRDVVALTPSAGRRLWSFFADHRSFAGKVRWNGPVGDPFAYHLREQEWDTDRVWSWMLRIIDAERALNERGYPAGIETDLHLEITDDVLPSNTGRFVLNVSGGKGELRRGGEGRVTVDIRGLAPLYTGFLGAEQLKATGYIEGPDADLARATAIFAGPAPWLADFF